MFKNYIIIIFIFTNLFSQEMPGDPDIAWMSTEYDLIDENITITISWNMWWGENGDHWKLIENSNNIFESSLTSNSPNPQYDETEIILTSEGEYEYIVKLCNGIDDSEICSESNPIIITILGDNDDSDGDEEDDVNLIFNKNIVGYYTSWSIYARNYEITDIPVEKINIINYAFANINPSSGTILLGDPYADIDKFYPGDCWDNDCLRGNFHQLQILKENYSHLKTFISVGGWTWSTYFSDIAMTDESRTIFAQSCVDFIVEYGFDGIDIDWEYPIEGGLESNHNSPNDKENFTLLLQKIRELLDIQSENDGNYYLLTIASTGSPMYVENIEVNLIHEYLDWINIMTYDFHGPWGGELNAVTNFNSPLYFTEDDPSPEPVNTTFNLDAAVQLYLDLGVANEKINAGLAFYGRSFSGVSNINNGLFSPYTGVPDLGTWEDGVFDYWDLKDNYINLNNYTSYWHPEAKVPWLYNPNTQIMISYDDEISIYEKASYIIDKDIGGAMFWEFSGDKYSELLNQVYDVFNLESNENIMGDLNTDGHLNVIDIVLMVNFVLDNNYNFYADMNEDSVVNILDIVELVNIILLD
jgi:chitinase